MKKPSTKLKVNDPCPCGSGRKFKKCHGGPNPPDVPLPGQVDARLKKLVPPKICLAPSSIHLQCSGAPIDSHTVSRSGSLGAIARDGHVYSYRISLQALVKSRGRVLPSLTGWRKASTFPGFCGTHDKELFAPLEDVPFIGSKKQCFLLAYRAINYEFYAKHVSALHSQYRDAITTGNEAANSFATHFNHGVSLGLNDAHLHKKTYDDMLISEDWDSVRTELIEFDGIFPIQCACAFFPELDVNGARVQHLGQENKKLDALSMISFAADGRSYFCFCWLENSNESCEKYIHPLRLAKRESLPIILASIILQMSENCHFSPLWYDGLSAEGKEWCGTQMMNGMPTLELINPPITNAALPYLSGHTVRQWTSSMTPE